MDSLPEDAGAGPLAVLSRFRVDFHACLTARADELSELADAVLCAGEPVRVLAGLSLAPEHRRGYGALYDAVNHWKITVQVALVCGRLVERHGQRPGGLGAEQPPRAWLRFRRVEQAIDRGPPAQRPAVEIGQRVLRPAAIHWPTAGLARDDSSHCDVLAARAGRYPCDDRGVVDECALAPSATATSVSPSSQSTSAIGGTPASTTPADYPRLNTDLVPGVLHVAAMSFGGLISQLVRSRPIGGVGRAKDRRVRVVVPRRGCRGPR